MCGVSTSHLVASSDPTTQNQKDRNVCVDRGGLYTGEYAKLAVSRYLQVRGEGRQVLSQYITLASVMDTTSCRNGLINSVILKSNLQPQRTGEWSL